MRIPPDISRLEHLTFLDLSYNKLRSLPAELGDLANLRELLLSHNYLRVLPYELGKLFQLQVHNCPAYLPSCRRLLDAFIGSKNVFFISLIESVRRILA